MDVTPCPSERASEVVDLLAEHDINPQRRETLVGDFTSIYFQNPWVDPELQPLICTIDGKIQGFLGITPRVMKLGDRQLRVAVSSNFTVARDAPEKHRPFIAARLIKTMIAGPQDLCLADGATDLSRRIWQRCGGSLSPALGLDWFHTIRPARGLWEFARAPLDPSPAIDRLAVMGASATDILAGRYANKLSSNENEISDLDLDQLVLTSDRKISAPLRPVMTRAWLEWLLERCSRLAHDGRVRSGAILKNGEIEGWFLYVMRSASLADVMQSESFSDEGAAGIGAVIADARQAGAALVRGHARLQHLFAYRKHSCLLNSGRFVLTHSRDAEILRPLADGSAWVSMLDGERWIGDFQR